MNQSIRKRCAFAILLAVCAVVLSACSFSDLMSWGTGVKQDPDYQTWEKLNEKGTLDSEGKYTSTAVHVTFAQNGRLEMHYFSDPEMTNELSPDGCYLFPGDWIYYSAKEKHVAGGTYIFDHLDVIEYDAENERMDYLPLQNINNTQAIMIPYDFTGTELSVEPAGRFGARQLIFQESVSDGSEADGIWQINKESISGKTVSINPLDTVTVEYKYDPEKYYFVSSEPQCWKADAADGLVIFNQSKPKTGDEKYSVRLEAYTNAELIVQNGMIFSAEMKDIIKIDGTGKQGVTVPRIRQSSIVTLETSTNNQNNIKIKCKLGSKIKGPTERTQDGQIRYVYEIEFGNADQFLFIPSEYTSIHGKLKFSVNGKEITEQLLLNSGMEIEYEAVETEEGYWLPDGKGKIVVTGSSTAKELKEIQFYPYRKVAVLLHQPKAGGKIRYSVNGELLKGTSADLYCGTRIQADMEADIGWEPVTGNEAVYIVSESNNQVITFDGLQVSGVFKEMDGHKPVLSVEISKDIGPTETSIEASGLTKSGITVSGGGNIFNTFDNIISGEKIGTDQNVRLTFANLDLAGDFNALKITVNKETKSGGFKEIYFVTKAYDPVNIQFAKDKEYKSVAIRIEASKTEPFKPLTVENAVFEAKYTDLTLDTSALSMVVAAGETISDTRQLEITIRPEEGFFMTGEYTKADIYTRKLNYGEYKRLDEEKIQAQLKKVCQFTLLTDDPYGKVEFLIDNQSVEGAVQVREGKELLVKYILENDDYEIAAQRDILTQAVNLVDKNVMKSMEVRKTITADEFDGTEKSRKDFIEIRKKVSE